MRWPALYQPPPQSTSSAKERISVVFVQYGHRRMAYGQMRRMAMMRRYAGKIQTARAAGLFGKLVTRLPRERLGEPVIDEDGLHRGTPEQRRTCGLSSARGSGSSA